LGSVDEILRRRGGHCSAAEFQAAVNVTFHHFESEHYDDLHQDMWRSLPAQVDLLARDCLQSGAPERIRMLDIGCGTGLATDCLLRTALGPRVESVDLLDTSASMMSRARKRREGWGKPGEEMEGLVESLAGHKQYNLIITCSVLHHVPHLGSFLNAVHALQSHSPGAFFIHLQDPNGDYIADPMFRERSKQISAGKIPEWMSRLHPRRVMGRMMREIKGEQGQDYVSKTNKELIRKGLIDSPLTTAELFAITDIRVQEGRGISIGQMKSWMTDYELISQRSYGFFGVLWSDLSPAFQATEEQLIASGELNGGHIGAVWRLASLKI